MITTDSCTFVSPLAHPGPRVPQRRISVSTSSLVVPVVLPPGRSLVEALDLVLAPLGVDSAQVELLDGNFTRLSYTYPAIDELGPAVVGYAQPASRAAAPARVIAGSATVGRRNGQRFVHCHAAWFDSNGALHGGHLWPADCMIGPDFRVVVHALDGVLSLSADDPESTLPVFTPQPRSAAGFRPGTGNDGEIRRAVMSRLAPGVELIGAVTDVMSEAGFRSASINGSLGSLVGAVIRRAGSTLVVDGPATEATLTGRLDASGQAVVTLIAIDRFGSVHTGLLVPGENIIAVTAELLVEEVAP